MSEPSLQLCLVFLVIAVAVRADNFTEKYMTMGPPNKYQSRQHRFLTFNTEADGDISLEMQFAVPFITIPVKKAMDMSKGAVANFNVAAVVVTGAIALVTGLILPAILKLVDQKIMPLPFNTAIGRDIKPESSELWRILTLMDQALIENNIDTTSCTQRAICWAVKNSISKASSGQATSKDKIIEGLVTNEWVNQLVEGTPIHSAIKMGMDGINCSAEYGSCKVSQKAIAAFVKQFTGAINLT